MEEMARLREEALIDAFAQERRVMAASQARQARLLTELTTIRLSRAANGTQEMAMRALTAELGCAANESEWVITRLMNDAETLRTLPATHAALADGSIGYRHAQNMITHAQVLPRYARAEFEVKLLPVARSTTPPRFDKAARKERELSHPESIETRTAVATASRSVRLDDDADGMALLTCHLPAVAAVAIDDRLDRIARAHATAEEPRTHAQLRADALTHLLLYTSSRAATAPTAGAAADSDVAAAADVTPTMSDDIIATIVPTVILTVPVLSLLGHDGGPADLHGYGPIDLPTARGLAAKAPSFVRILTHPDTGETLSVGRERYRPTNDMRLALQLADVTCRFPGCTRRAERCDLDHTQDWAHGGPTERTNLHHLCRKHHTMKHDTTGWTVRPGPSRTLTWTSPAGRTYKTTPGLTPTPPRLPVFTPTRR